ncbi:hypothetical protein FCI23_09630 [Actinacidiphila oryziradicis]|uniref:Uncharacterized protein n=1 Tax=Actinacidiphila oryziradicis TaxID=2571141 RepID=A0A4U0T8S8_9ACTN|nr:hypothetical protein FCI23_09630 [Actinacidiphila oryziradicis]
MLTEATDDVFDTGRQHPVPLLAGTNLDEGSVYAIPAASRELSAGPGFDGLYPAGDDGQARRSGRRFTGESRFVHPVWHWARNHRRTTGAPTWMYRATPRQRPAAAGQALVAAVPPRVRNCLPASVPLRR